MPFIFTPYKSPSQTTACRRCVRVSSLHACASDRQVALSSVTSARNWSTTTETVRTRRRNAKHSRTPVRATCAGPVGDDASPFIRSIPGISKLVEPRAKNEIISLSGPQLLSKEKQCTFQLFYIILEQKLYAAEQIW